MENCKQEGKIGSLEATVEAIKDTLDKISEGQERFVTVLEKIAAQGELIKSLSDGQNNLFERVRQVEIKQETERVRLASLIGALSIVISAVTAWIAKVWEGGG